MLQRRLLVRIAAFSSLLVFLAAVAVVVRFAWPRPRHNLLLVTLDTTRADHIGCYGYPHAQTTTLDALAGDGVLFENANVTVPMTLPSHASLLTGLYPPENGLHNNGKGALGSGFRTLAEVLAEKRYDTAAFLASVVLRSKAGLNRGFQTYDDDMAGGEPTGDEAHLMRDGKLVVDAALRWLENRRSQPFFCWVHLYDPHAPFEAHADIFGGRFRDRPYDGDIAYADLQIGRLVTFLKQRGLYEQTVIVVVGDHGEGLGEHLELEHGFMLYNSTLRVPLIVRSPTRCKPGHRVSTPVSLVDLFPTIFDTLRIPMPERVSGASLQSALMGLPIAPHDCYSETESAFVAYGWAPLRGVTTDRWKYVHTTRDELYDLQIDPGELHDLAESQPEQLEEMRQRLAVLEQQMVECPETDVPLTAAHRRALESLGYVTGAKPVPAATAKPLPDIKDMIPLYNTVGEAWVQMQGGKVNEAVERLHGVVRAAPEFVIARLILAKGLRMQNQMDKATDMYEATLKINPDSHTAHFDFASHFFSLQQIDKAIEHYEAGLKIDPSDSMAHFTLAGILNSSGDLAGARKHFEQGLAVTPNSAVGQFGYGVFLKSRGDLAGALQHVGRALQLSPQDPHIHYQLGVLLGLTGDFDGAAVHFEEALRRNPQFPNAAEQWQRVRKRQPPVD